MEIEPIGEALGAETGLYAPHAARRGIKRKVEGRTTYLLVDAGEVETGSLPDNDGVSRGLRGGEKVLVTRHVDIGAVSPKVSSEKTVLIHFGTDCLGEAGRPGGLESEIIDVVDVHHTTKAVSQVGRCPLYQHAFAGSLILPVGTKPSIVDAEEFGGNVARLAGPRAEPPAGRHAARTVVRHPQEQIDTRIDRPEEPISDDEALLRRA